MVRLTALLKSASNRNRPGADPQSMAKKKALTNADIAELLARESEHASMPARKALRLFTPRQVMAYLRHLEDDFPDPALVMLDALDEGVDKQADRWKQVREDAVPARRPR